MVSGATYFSRSLGFNIVSGGTYISYQGDPPYGFMGTIFQKVPNMVSGASYSIRPGGSPIWFQGQHISEGQGDSQYG